MGALDPEVGWRSLHLFEQAVAPRLVEAGLRPKPADVAPRPSAPRIWAGMFPDSETIPVPASSPADRKSRGRTGTELRPSVAGAQSDGSTTLIVASAPRASNAACVAPRMCWRQ